MSKEFLMTYCYDFGPCDARNPAKTIICAQSKKSACERLIAGQGYYKVECIFSVQELKRDDSVPREFHSYVPHHLLK